MLSFNYRILCIDAEKPTFEICEVWSNPLPFRFTKTGIKGGDIEEIRAALYSLNEALNKDVLYGGERFPEVFDYDKFTKQQKE